MAEEFAFDEGFADGGAVDSDVGLIEAAAIFVEFASDEFFASAIFAFDEDGSVGHTDFLDYFFKC